MIYNFPDHKGNQKFSLTKSSSSEELKKYFNAVLRLAKSDNEYPINLDEVWMLVYSQRDKAVRALKDNFIENVDYILLLQNGEQKTLQGSGGHNKIEYRISLSCMEFFIARKVRAVFEVYRQVFHRVATGAIASKPKQRKQSVTPTKVKAAIEWVKGVSDMLNLNDSSRLILLGKVAAPLEMPLPDYTSSKGVLKSASTLLHEMGSCMSAQKFNQSMIEAGYLRELSRESSKGIKRFKSLFGEGLSYGENQVNPQNPKETQPLYYADKFSELIVKLQAK